MVEIVSIVIPVYNSTKSLELLSEGIDSIFENHDLDYELIFVDDKSPNQESWEVLKKIVQKNKKVRIFQLSRNFGQQAATLCGIEHSKGNYLIRMDDDLQHRPEDIPLLLENKEHDIVIGSFQSKKHSLFKVITSKIKGHFDYLLIGKPKHIQLSPFRLINRIVIDGILKIKTAYPFIPALMFYVSKDVVSVNVTHEKRYQGKSNYNLRKMIRVFSNLMISNSTFLLKLIGQLGMFTSILSFLFGITIIFRKLFWGINVTGWTSNIVAILFIGGLILFTLGIIGEYLLRIIVGVEQKPTYIIREAK